ncbi:LLM class flavin-dependent oxidoreductase [Microbacterium sp. SORGH_AS_0888]|uniref:LLM class flavin-dependent oxidoreductase n=1 Tax=Microbacterium sp. SORGH_AS_0888 TaxID=3041791 RepID=UPI00277F8291|nr:LLM class flavin-dependent oxidoreductase [Microbacterium sp. SORGH_AS_0888]MDQ1129182.1 alkanesulfonate monooxygenase SsuD/methylene tetrahydromethanopterin reductase-like flavin-dependent oxidoreductase (luciferase family) [Microbacterium sp. SORGH_AS_0888]
MTASVSLGIAGTLAPDLVAGIARAAEDAGLHALWVNDTPDGDALVRLAAAAAVTSRLGLSTGVLPLDRRPAASLPGEIGPAVPASRLTLGIGSGALRRGALACVADGIRTLRAAGGFRILVGALGPRMRRLGAEDADGVLLSWLTPGVAAAQAAEAREARAGAVAALYVRTAFDPDGGARLREEAARYGSYPQYAANFARLGIAPGDTVLTADDGDVAAGLAAYREAVDEVVLRAIVAEETLPAYREFIDRAAQALA